MMNIVVRLYNQQNQWLARTFSFFFFIVIYLYNIIFFSKKEKKLKLLFHLSLTKKRLLNKLIENKFFLKTKIILLINLNIIKSIF